MLRFKRHAKECIGHAYQVEGVIERAAANGRLSTSLAEDVIFLIDTQCKVLQEYLQTKNLWSTRQGNDFYVDGLMNIFRCLCEMHKQQRPLFLTTLEDCCAAANDFFRLAEKMEALIASILDNGPMFRQQEEENWCAEYLRREANGYLLMLNQDAVLAAERTHVFLIRIVNKTSLPADLFSRAWEDEWTQNQVAQQLVNMTDRFLTDIERFLGNDVLYKKALFVTCKAVVCFYIRCLIEKADSVSRRRRNRDRMGMGERQPFRNTKRAMIRMLDDILIIKGYFEDKVKSQSGLISLIGNELFLLELVYECLDATDNDTLETLIVVIHKRTGADMLVTRHFVADLWLLVDRHNEEHHISKTLAQLQPDLQMVSSGLREQKNHRLKLAPPQSKQISFVQLDEMLKAMYEDRIVQGALPLCWTCLPKVEELHGTPIVADKIRALTRSLKEMQWKMNATP